MAGYSAQDIITTLFRITKVFEMPEYLKMECMKEIGFVHMRIADGVDSFCQLTAMLAKLCAIVRSAQQPPAAAS